MLCTVDQSLSAKPTGSVRHIRGVQESRAAIEMNMPVSVFQMFLRKGSCSLSDVRNYGLAFPDHCGIHEVKRCVKATGGVCPARFNDLGFASGLTLPGSVHSDYIIPRHTLQLRRL